MARRLIGLDIGTNAVRVAEVEPGEPPRIVSFGQVALPVDAMREGEVVDPLAVTAAIERLWKELSLRRGSEVRITVASPRLLVRTVDLPIMPESDLAGALRFQAQELIPIPLDEAVLDFQVIEVLPGASAAPGSTNGTDPDNGAEAPDLRASTAEPMQRVLLAAAHREMVDRLVGAVRGAGLRVTAVDLAPLALLRSLARRVSDNGPGGEAIVCIGGGVTIVVVHELGIPRFIRILGTGGRMLTDAIARDLGITPEHAEILKRQGNAAPDDLAAHARQALQGPLGDLVEQVRSSLDYYRSQPDSTRLLSVAITGGASLTLGLAEQLRAVLGIPVEPAQPRQVVTVGEIGFPPDQVPALDPYLPVPVGAALGGLATGRRIDLLGADAGRAIDARRVLMGVAIGGLALAVVLGGLWFLRKSSLDDEKDKLATVQARNQQLEAKAASLASADQTERQVEALSSQVEGILETDISWARMLQEIARTIPNDTWLTSFQGASTAGAPKTGFSTFAPSGGATSGGTTSGGNTISGGTSGTGTTGGTNTIGGGTDGSVTPTPTAGGTVNFSVNGLDFTSVSAWLARMGTQVPSFTELWVPSATRGATTSGGRQIVTFTSNAVVTSAARSDRLAAVRRDDG